MKRRTFLVLTLALAFFTDCSLRADDPIELKQHWQAGKKYYQTIKTDQQSSVELAGQKMDQKTSMTIDLTMAVTAAQGDQPKRMTIRYERMAMQMEMNGQKMGFDSAEPAANGDPLNFNKTVGAMVGQELKVTFNDKDEIDKVENYDEFVQHFGAAATPGFDPKKMFTRDSLTQMLKQGGLQSLPQMPVAIGESWPFSNQITLPQLGKVAVKGTYTLKSVGDHDGVRCAEIQTDGILSMDLTEGKKDEASPFSALDMKVMGGSIEGPVWFDPQLGFTRETHLVQGMTISMKNPADPSATITLPMKQDVTVKLTKVEDLK